jgi:hypothetical protein
VEDSRTAICGVLVLDSQEPPKSVLGLPCVTGESLLMNLRCCWDNGNAYFRELPEHIQHLL